MNLSQAYRQFGGAQRKYKGEEGIAKMVGEGAKQVGDALQFIGEAALPQAEAWKDFETGQKSVGVTGEDIQGPANLWQRMTKSPTDIMSGSVTAGDRSYDVASLQMMGTLKSGRDSLGATAIQALAGGKTMEEIYGKPIEGTDKPDGLSREPSMWEKAIGKLKETREWGGKREKDDDGKSITTSSTEPVKPVVTPVKKVEVKKPIVVEEPKAVIPVENDDSRGTTREENESAMQQAREKGLIGPGEFLYQLKGFKEVGKSRSARLEFFKELGITI